MQPQDSRVAQAGFTLVELMVALVVLSFAISAAFALAFSLMNGFKDHRHAVQVETNARIVLDLMASAIRASSPGLTSGQVWDLCTGGNIDTIALINSTTGPDQLRVVSASGGAFASLTSNQDIASAAVTVDSNRMFEADLWTPAIIVEPTTSSAHLVEAFAESSDPTSIKLRPPGNCAIAAPGDTTYDAGSFLVRATHMEYYVSPPFLMVDPDGPGVLASEIMAEGVEDFQIAIGVENGADTDSLSETLLKTDDEWHFNAPGDVAAPSVALGGWRAMRVTVVGINYDDVANGTNLMPAVEDRAAASVTDGHRRRVYTTTVNLRNFEASE